MSTDVMDTDEPVAPPAPAGVSLQERVAARQRENQQAPERAILLPVPGFEDMMLVQYRPLTYRESFVIETRHEKLKDQAESLLFVAADKLIKACERIVEPATDGGSDYVDTGYRWNTRTAEELFGCAMPEVDGRKPSARQALLAIFKSAAKTGEDSEELLIRHATAYEEQRGNVSSDESAEGESPASSAAI